MRNALAGVLEKLPQYLASFASYFEVGNHSALDKASSYLWGLCASEKSNMLSMTERVCATVHQNLQQMLTDSPWDHVGLIKAVGREVSQSFGSSGTALIIDESAFTKKGTHSVGVTRQYNGRLGKVDNCQVGVYAALAKEDRVALIDARLFLPKDWAADEERLEEASVPADHREMKSKVEIAKEMIFSAKDNGVQFEYVCFDGLYGNAGWLLRELDAAKIRFMADVHRDQLIYRRDPAPKVRSKTNSKRRKPSRPQSNATPIELMQWLKSRPAREWRRLEVRDAQKGPLVIEVQSARVWLWDKHEAKAHCWHLFVRRELGRPDTLKFCLSNAPANASLKCLAKMQGMRYWIEHAFLEAKDQLGMAEYQARKWRAWYHHMTLVILAMSFLLKERLTHRDAIKDLTLSDLVLAINTLLPRRAHDLESVIDLIIERHSRRQQARESAYRRHKGQAAQAA
jgi:SRSO17 transposase